MTLSKLAQLANVSVSVVSKAFSGRGDVSDAMREHVFEIARKHGCFMQFYHSRYDKPVIAVIIPEAISKFYINYIETLKKDIEENGYTMLLSISNFDNTMKDELVRYYTEHSKVDGLILIDNVYNISHKCDTVLICTVNDATVGLGASVSRNMRSGIRKCLEYLISAGHKKIAYVGEELTISRKRILLSELRALGAECDEALLYTSRSRFEEAGRDGVRKLFSSNTDKPTAILGAYGYITQGIISELESMGLRVPEDVSVVSLDSDPSPIHKTLDVACIPSDIDLVCSQIMTLLCDRIGTDEPNRPTNVVIDSSFRLGNTVSRL